MADDLDSLERMLNKILGDSSSKERPTEDHTILAVAAVLESLRTTAVLALADRAAVSGWVQDIRELVKELPPEATAAAVVRCLAAAGVHFGDLLRTELKAVGAV